MDNILTLFNIKDLENLSGIRAHTIRIWEKRYGLLQPNRTESNIRYYDLDNLKKLLNITILNNQGHKISKIASYTNEELELKVREYATSSDDKQYFYNSLKVSMLNFDRNLFEQTYNSLVAESSFREVFVDILVPFLQNIGLQWQSSSITPAHEHFITNLVKQKLLVNIERVQQIYPKDPKEVYVLYLPLNEIHEFGLLYIHYELLLKGKHSIYLGSSVPIDNLKSVQNIFNKLHLISYFTIKPDPEKIIDYLEKVNTKLLINREDSMTILGRRTQDLKLPEHLNKIKIFDDILKLTAFIQQS
jgi:DNA-binding transcriptional MerR regulator